MTRSITGTAPAAIPKPSISAGAGPVSGHSLLKAGSSGPEVQQLQKLLASEGFLQPPLTDQFDSRVSDAVKAYQTAKGLKVDGVVGQQTWGAFNGETNPPGSWLLKQPVGGYSGTSSFDANRSGPPMELNPSSDQIRGTAAQRRLVESARNVAMSMGGYQSQALCATGVSRAISQAMGINVSGNGNQIDNNLPRDKFRQVDMSLADALKTPGLILTWEHTSTTKGSLYGHTAITTGDGQSSISDFIERNTLASSGGRTGLKVFVPV